MTKFVKVTVALYPVIILTRTAPIRPKYYVARARAEAAGAHVFGPERQWAGVPQTKLPPER